MHLHQASVGQFVERIMAHPTRSGLNGQARLPTLKLHLRQAVADGVHAAMPICTLGADPLFKVRSIIEIEPFEKISTIDVDRLLKPGEDVVMSLFLMHSLSTRSLWSGASQFPGSLQDVQVKGKVGSEVEPDGVVLDEQMGVCGVAHLSERLAHIDKRTAKCCSALLLLTLRPQESGQLLTRMQTPGSHQIDEQRQGLACPKGEKLLAVANLWCAQEGEIQVGHLFTLLFTLLARCSGIFGAVTTNIGIIV